jgi:glycosyltransferase involved in cell wall biosynthesis
MDRAKMSETRFSIVIPVYNEQDNIAELHRRLTATMDSIQKEEPSKSGYEIIFVDDGSTDSSWLTIRTLNSKDPRIKGISFSRNFGHHKAIAAGLDYAAGDFVILMDGDLQDPPEEIPKLYTEIKQGYDIVYAIRETRNDPFRKKFFSKLFHRFFQTVAKVDIDPNSGIFRIINRKVVNAMKRCEERSRFIIGLMGWAGFNKTGVLTNREARHAGKTKYNFVKSTILALDFITSFSYSPLRIAAYLGALIAIISFIIGILMLIKKIFFGIPVYGFTTIIVSILFIGGVQLIIIGILGEYIGRIYAEVQKRPVYLLQDTLGMDDIINDERSKD